MSAGRAGQWTRRPSRTAHSIQRNAATRASLIEALRGPCDLADDRSRRCAAPHPPHSRSPEGPAVALRSHFRHALPVALVALFGLTAAAYAMEPNTSGRAEALFFAQL